MAAIEPLIGFRLAHIGDQRTAKEFTLFMKELAASFPEAKQIRVVVDTLNTHSMSSFYKHLPAEEALGLSNRLRSTTRRSRRVGRA